MFLPSLFYSNFQRAKVSTFQTVRLFLKIHDKGGARFLITNWVVSVEDHHKEEEESVRSSICQSHTRREPGHFNDPFSAGMQIHPFHFNPPALVLGDSDKAKRRLARFDLSE